MHGEKEKLNIWLGQPCSKHTIKEDPKEAHLANLCNLHFSPKNPKPITDLEIVPSHSTFLLKHFNYQSTSSIPSSVENELHKLLKLLIPSVKVEQVEDELQKPTLDVKVE